MIGMIPTRYFPTVVTLESIGLPIWPPTFFLSIESNGAYMFLTRYRSIINLLLTNQLHVFWPPVRTWFNVKPYSKCVRRSSKEGFMHFKSFIHFNENDRKSLFYFCKAEDKLSGWKTKIDNTEAIRWHPDISVYS